MQPPSQDPPYHSNQPGQSSSYLQTDRTVPLQPLAGSTFPQNDGQREHSGEESNSGVVPLQPSGHYPAPYQPDPDIKTGQPGRCNTMAIVVLVLLALVIIPGATPARAARYIISPLVVQVPMAPSPTEAGQVNPALTALSVPGQATQPAPVVSTLNSYSAAQPDPRCKINGSIWTTQELKQIQSGTTVSSAYNSRVPGPPACKECNLPGNQQKKHHGWWLKLRRWLCVPRSG